MLRVLICDDVAALRRMLSLALAAEGDFDVVGEAGDGRAAVDLAARLQPDAVLLDVAMPVLDGLEALPLIRKQAPGARVIVLTGFSDADLRERAMAGGAARFLEKGILPQRLADELRKACGAAR